MLVELAIGDAYGAGFEYSPSFMVREQNDLSRYAQHPRHEIRPGCYTDDAQMSIAIAEVIVSREPWTRENLARRFVTAFKRDPRKGYARGFYAFLQEISSGDEFLSKINPHSDKSGAAMRAAPIGIFPDVETVIERCELQAALTHDTPDGINAAIAASLFAHYFIYNLGPKSELPQFISDFVPGCWLAPWQGKVGAKGIMSVHAKQRGDTAPFRGQGIEGVKAHGSLPNLVSLETAHAKRMTFQRRRPLEIGVVRSRRSCVVALSDKRRGSRRLAASSGTLDCGSDAWLVGSCSRPL